MTKGIGLDSVAHGPNPATTGTGVIAVMTTAGTAPVPSTDPPVTAPPITGAPVHTATVETLPTADLLLAITPPKTTADLSTAPDNASTNLSKDHQMQHRHHLLNMKTGDRNINRSLLMIHPQNIIVQMTVKLTLKMIKTRCALSQNMFMERAIQ